MKTKIPQEKDKLMDTRAKHFLLCMTWNFFFLFFNLDCLLGFTDILGLFHFFNLVNHVCFCVMLVCVPGSLFQ